MLSRRAMQTAAAGALILCYFLYNAGAGVRALFTQDDILNLYKSWTTPFGALIDGNVLFFLPVYRPLGGLFYRLVFVFADLNPFPYRAVCFVILALNLLLLYGFARRISGSRLVGGFAVLLGAFHTGMADLYFSSGTIYDLLAFTFFLTAFDYYLRIRQRDEIPHTGQTLLLLVLFVLALDAKEMGVVLPVTIFVWELLFHPPVWNQEGIRSWIWNEGRVGFAMAPIAALQVLSRFASASPFAGNPSYQMVFTLQRYIEMWASLLGQLVYQPPLWFQPWMVIAFFAFLVVIAAALRSRLAVFCLLFLLIAELPVAFLPVRGLFVLYLPLAGLQILIGMALARIAGNRIYVQAALLLAAALALTVLNDRHRAGMLWWTEAPSRRIHALIDDAKRMRIPRGAGVILLNDPFEQTEWTPVSILRLVNRNSDLYVRRDRMGDDVTPKPSDYVFRFDGERLVLVRGPVSAAGPGQAAKN